MHLYAVTIAPETLCSRAATFPNPQDPIFGFLTLIIIYIPPPQKYQVFFYVTVELFSLHPHSLKIDASPQKQIIVEGYMAYLYSQMMRLIISGCEECIICEIN